MPAYQDSPHPTGEKMKCLCALLSPAVNHDLIDSSRTARRGWQAITTAYLLGDLRSEGKDKNEEEVEEEERRGVRRGRVRRWEHERDVCTHTCSHTRTHTHTSTYTHAHTWKEVKVDGCASVTCEHRCMSMLVCLFWLIFGKIMQRSENNAPRQSLALI